MKFEIKKHDGKLEKRRNLVNGDRIKKNKGVEKGVKEVREKRRNTL